MLKEKLSALLDELDGVDNRIRNKDEVIKKVQEENEYLQKQIDEGFKSFNTETHCLVERDTLHEIIATLDEIDTDSTEENIGQARSYCEEAEYSLGDITTYRDDAVKYVNEILDDTMVDDEISELKVTAKKSPATKQ